MKLPEAQVQTQIIDSSVWISVLMPTYNRADCITEALDSVQHQDYRPIEVVIVDDGSTDDTEQIVKRWSDSHCDDELTLTFVRQDNAGPGAARNRAFELSTGSLIQYLDSDDRIHLNRFSILAPLFDGSSIDFVQTGFEGFCTDCGEVFEVHHGNPDVDQLVLALRGRLWPNTLRAMFRRTAVEASGGWNTEMTCFEDYEFVVRVLGVCRGSTAVAEVLASARRGGSGPRVTDRLRTREGRGFRIMCEQAVAEASRRRGDLPPKELAAFASRVFALGFRSNGSGWPEHGKACFEIATKIDAPLDRLGRRRKRVARLGRWGGFVYDRIAKVKNTVLRQQSSVVRQHYCENE